MIPSRRIFCAAFILAATLLASSAMATEGIYSDDCVPPPDTYIGGFHARYLQGQIDLSQPQHERFTECDTLSKTAAAHGAPVTHTFGSTVNFRVSFGGGPLQSMTAPAMVTVRLDLTSNVGGVRSYDTEMLQLDIVGGNMPPGTMVRESPTLASTGKTTIRDLGGGQFGIDSFFDIFTELSLDGGQTWNPSETGAGHMNLSPANPTPTRSTTWGAIKRRYGDME